MDVQSRFWPQWNNGTFASMESLPSPMIVSSVTMHYSREHTYSLCRSLSSFRGEFHLCTSHSRLQLNTYRFDQDVRPQPPQASHGLSAHRSALSNQFTCVV